MESFPFNAPYITQFGLLQVQNKRLSTINAVCETMAMTELRFRSVKDTPIELIHFTIQCEPNVLDCREDDTYVGNDRQQVCEKSLPPPSTTLSALIDSGYSASFGIQFYPADKFHEPEVYTFDSEDRRNWGNTEMFACRLHLWDSCEPLPCYASAWIGSLHRLVCFDEKVMVDRV